MKKTSVVFFLSTGFFHPELISQLQAKYWKQESKLDFACSFFFPEHIISASCGEEGSRRLM